MWSCPQREAEAEGPGQGERVHPRANFCSVSDTWASETNREHTVSHSFHSRNLLSTILSGARRGDGKAKRPNPSEPTACRAEMRSLGQG